MTSVSSTDAGPEPSPAAAASPGGAPREAEALPAVRLKPGAQKRLARGYPWAYSNEIEMDAEAREVPPGGLVRLVDSRGEALGTALFNRRPLIAARLVSRRSDVTVDRDFLAARLARALEIREALFDHPYYRLCHAEADGLPGTVIDRFGSSLVLQVNTAGMARLLPDLLAALDRLLEPETVVLRNDSAARELEGLDREVEIAKGSLEGASELVENGARYLADLRAGQKTGWFYDQRDNRALVRRLTAGFPGGRVLDAYSYTGGFAIQAALAGAQEVVAVDRSQAALELAAEAAQLNGVGARCRFVRAEVFADLAERARKGERFDLVVVDPPAFVKTKRELPQGLKGYRKLLRLAALAVKPGGILVAASCSHHVDAGAFSEQLRRGLQDAGREGRILYQRGAGPDHPLHPFLPETAYLKLQVAAVD
ncbi:MAG: class I SAM-dependent rRNA methyltransferase [Kiloniellales bacterium]|nr:class I SAM-dependent rRNA methyltransferase [Kiloniellales bacterium]